MEEPTSEGEARAPLMLLTQYVWVFVELFWPLVCVF